MKPTLVSRYRFEYIINVKVFIFGLNLGVSIDVPVEETSRSALNEPIYHHKGMYPLLPDDSFEESLLDSPK